MTKRITTSGSISRRRLLTTVSAGAALAASPFRINLLQAEEATIKIGFPVPLTGPYGAEAQDQVRAAQVAIAQFNDGGGLNGRKAELVVRDDKLNPGEAATRTLELVEKEKVNFVVGSLSAAVQLAINNVTKERGIIFNSISQSDAINEAKDFSKYTFHEALNPHMTAGAVGALRVSEIRQEGRVPDRRLCLRHRDAARLPRRRQGLQYRESRRCPSSARHHRLLDLAAAPAGDEARHPLHLQFRARSADLAEAGDRFRGQEIDPDHRAAIVACQPRRGRTAGIRRRDRRLLVLLGPGRQVRLHQGVQRRVRQDV